MYLNIKSLSMAYKKNYQNVLSIFS